MATPGRASVTAVLAVVGATALVVLLATLASAGGPGPVLHGVGRQVSSSFVPEASTSAPDPIGAARRAAGKQAPPHPAPTWLRFVFELLELLVAVAVLIAAAVGLRRLLKTVRDRLALIRPPPEPVDFETLDPVAALVAALDADSDAQQRALEHGEPRNAIVACWAQLESAAERIDVHRQPWQTSAEFVLDILEQVDADAGSVTRLSDLYREARFSDHPLTEDHRRRAREALTDAQRSWRRTTATATA